MRKYLELRRRALKLDKIDVFDLYVPIVEDVDYPIAFEDAKELVKKATLPLGEEYQKLLTARSPSAGSTYMRTTASSPARSRAACSACIRMC